LAFTRKLPWNLSQWLLSAEVFAIWLFGVRYDYDSAEKRSPKSIACSAPDYSIVDDMGVDGAAITYLAQFDPAFPFKDRNGVLHPPARSTC